MAEILAQHKLSEPSIPIRVDIKSNNPKLEPVSLVNGFVRMQYFESLLQDSIEVSYVYADTGNVSFQNKSKEVLYVKSVREGLPLVGTEDVTLSIQDNQGNQIKVELNVNEVTPVLDDTQRTLLNINLVSEEVIRNEVGTSKVTKRYKEQPNDEYIKSILKDNLKTKKALDIEETYSGGDNYSFLGNGRKAFYTLNWLSRLSIPKTVKSGGSAGFWLFETAKDDGMGSVFKFKSIDSLFAQDYKKSYAFTNTTKLPGGYDSNIVEHFADNRLNAQQALRIGTWQTKLIMFDPFRGTYRIYSQDAEQTKKDKQVVTAGKLFPKLNDKFGLDDSNTRTTYMMVDVGSLPAGTTQKQIEKAQDANLMTGDILNQAIRRYNQMFTALQTITIAGDFSLRAGDAIYIDTPSIGDDAPDAEFGGKYVIIDLCHFMSTEGTWTKLNLTRDSFGRRPMSYKETGTPQKKVIIPKSRGSNFL